MLPVRRDIRFALPPERICDWHKDGPAVTLFFDALSLKFPAGERFFIESVRHYRDRIDDPELKQQVLGFIGQEAMHTREHTEYNDLLDLAGLPAAALDKRMWFVTKLLHKYLPAPMQLAMTIAFEHYTAMLANMVLRDPQRFVGGLDAYSQVWVWHAIEETEHKSVAFDVWNTAIKPGLGRYLLRTSVMLLVNFLFWVFLFDFHVRLLLSYRKRHGKIGFGNMWRVVKLLYAPKGIFFSIIGEWLDYFRPGFHPWDHDNRAYLTGIDALLEKVERSNAQYAPQAAARRVLLHPQPQPQA